MTNATHSQADDLQQSLDGWLNDADDLFGEPLVFETAEAHLQAEILWVFGLLLERLHKQGIESRNGLSPQQLKARIDQAEAEADQRAVELPILTLVRRLSLLPSQRGLLTLVVTRAVCTSMSGLLTALQGSQEWSLFSLSLANAILNPNQVTLGAPPTLFGPGNFLFCRELLRALPMPGMPSDLLVDRVLLPSDALLSFVCGYRSLSSPLVGLAEHVTNPIKLVDLVLRVDVRRCLESIAVSLDPYLELFDKVRRDECASSSKRFLPPGPMVLLSGPSGCGKSLAAEALAGSAGKSLIRLSLARVQERMPEVLSEVFQQALLLDASICLDDAEVLTHGDRGALVALIEGARDHRGLTVLTTTEPGKLDSALASHRMFHLSLGRPDAAQREQLWEIHLHQRIPLAEDPPIHELSYQYELTGAQIRNAVAASVFTSAFRSSGQVALRAADLRQMAQDQLVSRHHDENVEDVQRYGLDAIVLAEETMGTVIELRDAARVRAGVLNEWGFGKRLSTGKGIVALFKGDPGTGKTYCAELLAAELGLRFQLVAIPQVMSKWVGETEKNISRLFSHARAQNTLLVFDEADALFTKRVTVQQASDRFSNMEVNQLLQEVDRFEGVVILTTNLETSIDRAFTRRIGYHIEFPMPDESQRAKIWETLLPREVPLGERIDFVLLAQRYEITGGHIKNALLRAAYRARSRSEPLVTGDLMEAAESECRAMGKLLRNMDERKRRRGESHGQ